MDWQQAIIDYPILALLAVIPMVGLAAFIKIGVVLATGAEEPPP